MESGRRHAEKRCCSLMCETCALTFPLICNLNIEYLLRSTTVSEVWTKTVLKYLKYFHSPDRTTRPTATVIQFLTAIYFSYICLVPEHFSVKYWEILSALPLCHFISIFLFFWLPPLCSTFLPLFHTQCTNGPNLNLHSYDLTCIQNTRH